MPFPMQPTLYISVLKLSVLVFTSALCILANFHVYLLLCTCRTVILLGMGPISTYLKSAVIFEERKIDSTPVKSLFCFQDFKTYFMHWSTLLVLNHKDLHTYHRLLCSNIWSFKERKSWGMGGSLRYLLLVRIWIEYSSRPAYIRKEKLPLEPRKQSFT